MRTARVRCYAALAELAGGAEHEVAVAEPRSVKDLVESLGVPHPEVGAIVVDGEPVGLDARVAGGERVACYPPFRRLGGVPATAPDPPRPPRFVLDVHLGALARRLRVLGFDARYRRDADDDWLAAVAVDEGRVLLTRDRELLMRRPIVHGYCPRSDDPDAQAREVAERYDLAEHTAPMTRCPRCNGTLAPAEPGEVADRVPPRTSAAFERFACCADCGQVYWRGAHAEDLDRLVARVTL